MCLANSRIAQVRNGVPVTLVKHRRANGKLASETSFRNPYTPAEVLATARFEPLGTSRGLGFSPARRSIPARRRDDLAAQCGHPRQNLVLREPHVLGLNSESPAIRFSRRHGQNRERPRTNLINRGT